MKWNIVVDSSCDLMNLKTLAPDTGYERVPLKIITGDYEFVDDGSGDPKELLQMLHASHSSSSSACPAPQEWADAFEKADYTLAFSLTGGLSGSFNSALTAKHMVEEDHPEKKIFILDTLSAGPEISLLVYKANELIHQGLEFEEICSQITEYHEHTHLMFILSNLDTLVKNGRVSKVVAAMVGMMKIRLVGVASEQGTLEVVDKCRGFKKAVTQVLASLANAGFRGGRLLIAHSSNEKEATVLANAIHVSFPEAHISMMETSGLCSYYAEEGGILIGFEA
ncbi:MAG: DegV family protein [Eubacteriales bacterium]|nr:DegV family protein [Eubacteriales bacterium]